MHSDIQPKINWQYEIIKTSITTVLRSVCLRYFLSKLCLCQKWRPYLQLRLAHRVQEVLAVICLTILLPFPVVLERGF